MQPQATIAALLDPCYSLLSGLPASTLEPLHSMLYLSTEVFKTHTSEDVISLSKALQGLSIALSEISALYPDLRGRRECSRSLSIWHRLSPFSSALLSGTLAAIFPAQLCQAHPYIRALCRYYSAACSAFPQIPGRLVPSSHPHFSSWP